MPLCWACAHVDPIGTARGLGGETVRSLGLRRIDNPAMYTFVQDNLVSGTARRFARFGIVKDTLRHRGEDRAVFDFGRGQPHLTPRCSERGEQHFGLGGVHFKCDAPAGRFTLGLGIPDGWYIATTRERDVALNLPSGGGFCAFRPLVVRFGGCNTDHFARLGIVDLARGKCSVQHREFGHTSANSHEVTGHAKANLQHQFGISFDRCIAENAEKAAVRHFG